MEKNITGEKMLSHIDRIAGEKKPITADIFLTNYCNNSCLLYTSDAADEL